MDPLRRILVVDDDASIQTILGDALVDNGFEPTTAMTGEDALVHLKTDRFDLLIVDISFGSDRIRGWDVARRVRAAQPGIPVVYISGGDLNDWSVQGVPQSIVLRKPFVPSQLVTSIAHLLADALP